MQIKKIRLQAIIPAVVILGLCFSYPVMAEMKQVDETDLAKTRLSVTGLAVKEVDADVEKGLGNPETERALGTYKTEVTDPSQSWSSNVNTTDALGLSLNVKGQETFQYYFGGTHTTTTGGIKTVAPR